MSPDEDRDSTPAARRHVDDAPVIPGVPAEETDAGWGAEPDNVQDWLQRERPPHHGGD